MLQAQWAPFLMNREPIGYTPVDYEHVYSIWTTNVQDTTVRVILDEIVDGVKSGSDTFELPVYIQERRQLLAHFALNTELFFFTINKPIDFNKSENTFLRYDRKRGLLDTVNIWIQIQGKKEGFFEFCDDVHGFYFGPLNESRRCRTIYTTSDAGDSWQLLDPANSLPWEEYQIELRSVGNGGYTTGDAQVLESRCDIGFIQYYETVSKSVGVLKYTDFGMKWTKIVLPDTLGGLYKFSALSNVHWTMTNTKMQVFHTKDAGETWQFDSESTKVFAELGPIVDLKWSPYYNYGRFTPFLLVNCRKSNIERFTYISFDSCKSWVKLDSFQFLSFYFKPNCLGIGQRQIVKPIPGGNYSYILTGFFDFPVARALSYPKITEPNYVCKGESLTLSVELGDPSYWSLHSDGRDTFQVGMPLRITPTQNMEVYLFSPYHSDTLEIIVREPFPEEELETSYSVCSDSSLEIDLSHLPFAGFSWSNGQIGAIFKSNVAGNYMLHVEADYYCAGDYSFSISNYPVRELTKDTAICPDYIDGIPINFKQELNALGWIAPSSLTALPEFKEEKDLAYSLIDTNGCLAFIQWHVFTTCPPEFYLPNAFHPGGPVEANQYFQPVSRYVDSFHIVIYNRWGQQVYSGTQLNKGWNGTFADQEAESGMYFYRIVYTYTKEPHLQERKNLEGKLYLMR